MQQNFTFQNSLIRNSAIDIRLNFDRYFKNEAHINTTVSIDFEHNLDCRSTYAIYFNSRPIDKSYVIYLRVHRRKEKKNISN